jgi:hypothetical protein
MLRGRAGIEGEEGGPVTRSQNFYKNFFPLNPPSNPIAEKPNTIPYIEFFTQNFLLSGVIGSTMVSKTIG